MDGSIKEGQVTLQPTPDDSTPAWRDGLDDRTRRHVAFCQNYAANHNHGAPGHIDYLTIDTLAKILDGQPVEITMCYEVTLSGSDEIQQQIAALLAKIGSVA